MAGKKLLPKKKKDDLMRMKQELRVVSKQLLSLTESRTSAAARRKENNAASEKPANFFYFLEYYHLQPNLVNKNYKYPLKTPGEFAIEAQAPWRRRPEGVAFFLTYRNAAMFSNGVTMNPFMFDEKIGIIISNNSENRTISQGMEKWIEDSLCGLPPIPLLNGIFKIPQEHYKIVAKLGSVRNAQISLVVFDTKNCSLLPKRGLMKKLELKEAAVSHLELVEEALILSKCLYSEHILSFYGISYMNGVSLFVEACPINLYCYLLKNKNKIELLDKLKWSKQAASAVSHINQLGIAHRNLKTMNCFLTELYNLKIGGFEYAIYGNISKEKQNPQDGFSTARTYKYNRDILRWMSPETVTYNEYDMCSEVWNFGTLVWEIYLEGDRPYPGSSDYLAKKKLNLEIAKSLKASEYRLEIPKNCPHRVTTVIEFCLSYAPDRRPDIAYIEKTLEFLFRMSLE